MSWCIDDWSYTRESRPFQIDQGGCSQKVKVKVKEDRGDTAIDCVVKPFWARRDEDRRERRMSRQQELRRLLPTTPPTARDDRRYCQRLQRYERAHAVLQGIILLVISYALGMVLAGRSFAMPLFDALRFGPNARLVTHHIDTSNIDGNTTAEEAIVMLFMDYCIFMFGVLGAVIVGWMTMVGYVIHDGCRLPTNTSPTTMLSAPPSLQQRAWSRKVVAFSFAIWFVLDTMFSLVIGLWQHGLFNIPFAVLFAVPLLIMEQSDDGSIAEVSILDPQSSQGYNAIK